MSTAEHIVNDQLPLSQDFKSLKQEGLAFIQQYSNTNWTNLNPSDPGITILDQVCFALTELGYCNDFKVEDILTSKDGTLSLDDQFYLPQDILTSSPITCADYIKYIADGVAGVHNAIVTNADNIGRSQGCQYQVYLLIDRSVADPMVIDNTCSATFFYLHTARNLGETFAMPKALQPVRHFMTGDIEISDATQLCAILAAIDQRIASFIFPAVVQSGYQQLIDKGFDINQVFNGPLLQNGWIPTDHLGQKRDQLRVTDLYDLVKAVPGIVSVSGVTLDNKAEQGVTSKSHELLVIDLDRSLQYGLKFYYKGSRVTVDPNQRPPGAPDGAQAAINNIQPGAAQQVQTTVPSGKYRDINSYYSIQNTFPEAFAVGGDAAYSNTSDFQIAQSRQLKGYLTLFDQVLANQFSQLANIGRLFSFKNTLTGTPSDEHDHYAIKDQHEREHPKYPVPYLRFASTYFYQSLYDVPYIRPLLKDFDTLQFGLGPGPQKALEHQSWLKYKNDPYNPYMWGLMQAVDNERDSLERRDAVLDHLLARHGESPVMIGTMIDGSVYTGDTLKDRVIFKSLYLQNLALLSYYRQKAYNYLAASPIPAMLSRVPANCEKEIMGGYAVDFIVDSHKIDRAEKLKGPDFIDYSALELKLCMLFGLKAQYRNYIVDGFGPQEDAENKRLAYWMIKQRRGAILIETALLLPYLGYEVILTSDVKAGPFRQIGEDLNCTQVSAIRNALANNSLTNLTSQLQGGTLIINGNTYTLTPAGILSQSNQWFKPVAGTSYFFTVRLKTGGEIQQPETSSLLNGKAVIIFPSFIPQLNTPAFKDRLNFFMYNTLPVHLSFEALYADSTSLANLVAIYTDWHNALIYDDKGPGISPDAKQAMLAGALASIINEINYWQQ